MRRISLLGRQTAAPPSSLVTDLVSGFIHGYSTARKLRSAYSGNCLTVRDADISGGLTNIGFLNNLLNESQIPSSQTNTGITTKYDQVGSRNLVYNNNIFHMPRIKVSGSNVKVSDRVYAQYDGTNDFLATSSATPITDLDCTVFVVFESQASNSVTTPFQEWRASNDGFYMLSDTRAIEFFHSNYRVDGTPRQMFFSSQQPTSTKRCYILRKIGNDVEAYDETNTLIATINSSAVFSGNTVLQLGRALTGALYFNGKIAELLINNTALSTTDRNLVLDNIKDFYSIV